MESVVLLLNKIVPTPIRRVFKFIGFNRIMTRFLTKYGTELIFQTQWAKVFKDNKNMVLEYWKKFRYLDEIKKICKIKEYTKVLDVGCGISSILHFINGKRYGIDPLAPEYKRIYSYPEGIYIQKGLAEEIPFPDQYFDIAFCSNALDHIRNPKKAINEIHRVLKPKGIFVLTVEVFEKKAKRDPAHLHSLTRTDVYTLLKNTFKTVFRRESPWIGIRAYVSGSRISHTCESVMVLKRI